jgi:hypothetical protein
MLSPPGSQARKMRLQRNTEFHQMYIELFEDNIGNPDDISIDTSDVNGI